MNDYFNEVSYGQFSFSRVEETEDVENDGVITIHLNKDHPNADIGTTESAWNLFKDKVHPDLVSAIQQAGLDIDFAQYDTDSDQQIEPHELTVIFIMAGQEDAYWGGHRTNGVWAHMAEIDSAVNVDGVDMLAFPGNYAIFGERHDNHNATIGIIAHELGHARFNLPDLYDTVSGGFGIGAFGLMGAGTWAQADSQTEPGATPVHLTAWSKIRNKWVTPSSTSGDVTFMESAATSFNVERVPLSSGNYLLIENRNNSGYDQGLYILDGTFSGGLAIWEIDESIINSGEASNQVNVGTNQGVKLIQAVQTDGAVFGHETNLFYLGNVNNYTDDTTNITSISTRGSSMSATINY